MEVVAAQQQQQAFAVPVPRRSPEWGWLEYLLQVSCQTTKLRLRQSWSVANKRLAVECEQRCRGLLQLHAWVPVVELPQDTSVQEICYNGFRMSHTGLSFHIGNVQLPGVLRGAEPREKPGALGHDVRGRGRALPAGRRLYEFLLCRVGVGRSYRVDNARSAEGLELPPEYDSFIIRREAAEETALDEEYPGVLPRHVLHSEYIVRDPSQALPLYLVHFEYDPEAPEFLALPLCDNCGLQGSLLYCEADDANLCRACDARIHSTNCIAAKHVRVEINRRPGAPKGQCPEHPDQEADLYCMECCLPLCVHCRSLGSHSAGEAKQHRCIGLLEAYDEALRNDPKVGKDGMLPDRKHVEEQLVAEIDSRILAVQDSTQYTEDMIYDQIQEAVQSGQELAEEQASLFRADEHEARRQLEQGYWLESFLEEAVKELPPADFLEAWLRHTAVRQELEELGALGQRMRTGAGLRVEGRLHLVAERGRRKPQGQGRGRSGASPSAARPNRFALDG